MATATSIAQRREELEDELAEANERYEKYKAKVDEWTGGVFTADGLPNVRYWNLQIKYQNADRDRDQIQEQLDDLEDEEEPSA